jgi:PKD repeat protein
MLFNDNSAWVTTETAWSWNFGFEWGESTDQNPNMWFPTLGTFTVTLSVTFEVTAVTVTKEGYVNVISWS